MRYAAQTYVTFFYYAACMDHPPIGTHVQYIPQVIVVSQCVFIIVTDGIMPILDPPLSLLHLNGEKEFKTKPTAYDVDAVHHADSKSDYAFFFLGFPKDVI